MIAQRNLVLLESLRARLMMSVSHGALAGEVAFSRFRVFDHRRLSADMAAANWHTRTELKN